MPVIVALVMLLGAAGDVPQTPASQSAPMVYGEPAPNAVRSRVLLESAALRRCYQAELRQTPDLHATVRISFTFGGSGQITQCSTDDATTLDACVAREICAIRFAPFFERLADGTSQVSSRAIEVRYALRFVPELVASGPLLCGSECLQQLVDRAVDVTPLGPPVRWKRRGRATTGIAAAPKPEPRRELKLPVPWPPHAPATQPSPRRDLPTIAPPRSDDPLEGIQQGAPLKL